MRWARPDVVKIAPPLPEIGSQRRFTENSNMRTSPNQKNGMETQNNAKKVVILSMMEYCFTAEISPIGIAMTTVNIKAEIVNSRVAGSLPVIRFKTGCFVTMD